jgi:hypothetical protein
MHTVMRENVRFKKEHDEDIRKLEKDYQGRIEDEKKAAVAEFYAKKQDRIVGGHTIDAQSSTYECDRD